MRGKWREVKKSLKKDAWICEQSLMNIKEVSLKNTYTLHLHQGLYYDPTNLQYTTNHLLIR